MIKISFTPFSLMFLFLFSMCHFILFHAANPNDGFTIELIHRDSPKSPLYQPNQNPFERFAAAVNRSLIRSGLFGPHERSMAAGVDIMSSGTCEYIMRIGIGTPPVEFVGFVDTGSPLIWTHCEPCIKCFPRINPPFKPRASSTYKNIAYSSHQCNVPSAVMYSGSGRVCMYKEIYADGSFSNGNLTTEMLTLGSLVHLSAIIGCGHENNFVTKVSSALGVVGLDFSDTSLISQLGPVINGIFSHCLPYMRSNRAGHISFGSHGVVSDPFAVTTLLTRKINSNSYFLTLEAVSVDETRLEFPGSVYGGATEGNIVIDSGITLTFLPMDFYNRVVTEVEKVVNGQKVKVDKMGLCYKAWQKDIILPTIKMHFKGGDVTPEPLELFPESLVDGCMFFVHRISEEYRDIWERCSDKFLSWI